VFWLQKICSITKIRKKERCIMVVPCNREENSVETVVMSRKETGEQLRKMQG